MRVQPGCSASLKRAARAAATRAPPTAGPQVSRAGATALPVARGRPSLAAASRGLGLLVLVLVLVLVLARMPVRERVVPPVARPLLLAARLEPQARRAVVLLARALAVVLQ